MTNTHRAAGLAIGFCLALGAAGSASAAAPASLPIDTATLALVAPQSATVPVASPSLTATSTAALQEVAYRKGRHTKRYRLGRPYHHGKRVYGPRTRVTVKKHYYAPPPARVVVRERYYAPPPAVVYAPPVVVAPPVYYGRPAAGCGVKVKVRRNGRVVTKVRNCGYGGHYGYSYGYGW